MAQNSTLSGNLLIETNHELTISHNLLRKVVHCIVAGKLRVNVNLLGEAGWNKESQDTVDPPKISSTYLIP